MIKAKRVLKKPTLATADHTSVLRPLTDAESARATGGALVSYELAARDDVSTVERGHRNWCSQCPRSPTPRGL